MTLVRTTLEYASLAASPRLALYATTITLQQVLLALLSP